MTVTVEKPQVIAEYRFDRFDIVEAYLLYYSRYHEAGATKRCQEKHLSLGNLRERVEASGGLGDPNNMSENARGIYLDIVARWEGTAQGNRERLNFYTSGWGDFTTTYMHAALPGLAEFISDFKIDNPEVYENED